MGRWCSCSQIQVHADTLGVLSLVTSEFLVGSVVNAIGSALREMGDAEERKRPFVAAAAKREARALRWPEICGDADRLRAARAILEEGAGASVEAGVGTLAESATEGAAAGGGTPASATDEEEAVTTLLGKLAVMIEADNRKRKEQVPLCMCQCGHTTVLHRCHVGRADT